MWTSSKRRHGFTLIELLVVIAIIAILAAILFPIFAKVKESGRKSSCLNNQKNCFLAFAAYIDDWNGTYPWAYGAWYFGPSKGARDRRWPGVMSRYLRSEKVVRCPSDIGISSPPSYAYYWLKKTQPPPYLLWQMQMTSYEYQGIDQMPSYRLAGKTMAGLRTPSKRVLLHDPVPWHFQLFHNILFCDGHLATMKTQPMLEAIWKGYYE
ncbi:MAG: prepilin-type N-terminal cleavage/methylation domain-containing protein [Armatimonadetes bacterium]|nr:prepilin-type N-terminal cleavage/methylation domain-containing protein [Armatimonadota bacterium]